jgi:hypothetical protein
MDRQVAALFGGIVAVGLGPAVWLGGTLFRPDPIPIGPVPGVTERVSELPVAVTSPESTPDPLPTLSAGADGIGPGLVATPGSMATPGGWSSGLTPGAPTAEPTTPSPSRPPPTVEPTPDVSPAR